MGRPKKEVVDPNIEFADAEGLPGNVKAKALAKAKSKKAQTPAHVFYTIKDMKKVVKMIVKPWGTQTIYIGNMRRHKDSLALMIAKWRKDNVWFEPHQVAEKIVELRAKLPALK